MDEIDAPAPAAERPPLTARSFTAWPAWADLSLDVVHYGPDIPNESELKLLGRLDGKRVLELGCGGGPVAVAMAAQGAKVIAIEPSAEQIGHARRLCEREGVSVELHQGDLADLAFVRADSIDMVVSVYTLGLVEDLDRVFRQVHRVLKPEAAFLVSLPHPAWRMGAGSTGDPPVVHRGWWDGSPIDWSDGGESGSDHPVTISDLFTSLTRANFRVDTLLEPEPPRTTARSRWWDPAMSRVPSTLVVRARKVGT